MTGNATGAAIDTPIARWRSIAAAASLYPEAQSLFEAQPLPETQPSFGAFMFFNYYPFFANTRA